MRDKYLITGSSGFIGFNLAKNILDQGHDVIGVDSLNNYYDVNLKKARQDILEKYQNFFSYNHSIESPGFMKDLIVKNKPDYIIHLAAQAGVRYSIENPRVYFESNLSGTFELLDACKIYKPKHLLISSTSSAYGANESMPFKENMKADNQLSFYAASKKASENLAHSYSHTYNIPITMFRFFTVYGPWGRPDMALFKFTNAILNNEEIDVYNKGDMSRDFTYIDDLISAINLLLKNIPSQDCKFDSVSPVAQYRLINIGNSSPTNLMDFINEIEKALKIKAKKNYLPMQPGDMKKTWANADLLNKLTGYKPKVSLEDGVKNFVQWYKEYYKI